MRKKGQATLVGIAIFIVVIIAIFQMIPILNDQLVDVRSDLDCGAADLTTGQIGTCIIFDTTLWYFAAVALAAALGGISGKFLKRQTNEQ